MCSTSYLQGQWERRKQQLESGAVLINIGMSDDQRTNLLYGFFIKGETISYAVFKEVFIKTTQFWQQ